MNQNRRQFSPLTLAVMAIGLSTAAGHFPVWAQSSVEVVQSSGVRLYQLPAGALPSTLNQIAREAGLTLTLDAAVASGLSAPAIQGRMTPEQALEQALTGSSLELVRTRSGAYVVRPRTATELSAVTVQAGRLGESERGLGPVDGYVARRSVTALKADIPLMETAQSVSIVTADQIEVQNAESLGQALRYTAAVLPIGSDQTVSDGLVIRGFNVTGSAPMYLNGSKLARNTFSGVAEPYAMERIELLKGPASVLYGNAAPGGVVNMVSKQPLAEPLRELKLQLGSNRRKQVAGDFSDKLNEDGSLSYRLTGLVRRSDTAVDFIPDDRNFLSGSVRWAPSARTSLTLLAMYQRNKSAYNYGLPFEGTVVENPNGKIARERFVGEPDFNHYATRNMTLGYLLSHQLNDTFTFRQNVLYFKSRADYGDVWIGGYTPDMRSIDRGAYVRAEKESMWSIDNQLEAKWRTGGIQHTSLLGLDYNEQRWERVQYAGNVSPLSLYQPVYGAPVVLGAQPAADVLEKPRQLGLYAQQHMKFDSGWVITLGGRYDKVRARGLDRPSGVSQTMYDESAFTGRAGVVYLFENGLAPYASYAQSFEPISGYTFSGGAFKPTKGEQYEVGVRYQPSGADYMLTASVYQLTQQNVLTNDLAHPGFSVQEGEVRSRGLELEARAHLGGGLNLIASYGYVQNVITQSTTGTQGFRTGGVPRHMASAWLDYDVNDAFNIGGGVRYQGSTLDTANTIRIPGFTVVDAAARYRFSPQWQLSVNVNNLFDKEYVTCSYACFYGVRRSIVATLGYQW